VAARHPGGGAVTRSRRFCLPGPRDRDGDPQVAFAHRAVTRSQRVCGASPRAVRLVAPGMLLRDGGVVDMCGLGVGLWYGVAGGMLYWET